MISNSYSLGLIGYPLGHSLSPQIHGAALHALGISGEYSLYPVQPLPEGKNNLANLLGRVRDGDIHGLNVTIPHKQNVIHLLDKLTPAAEVIGAVNTIFLEDGMLIGDNTDAPGFWRDLQQFATNRQPKNNSISKISRSALILGSGGSARAVAYALLTRGFDVTIAARRIKEGWKLLDQLSINKSSIITINQSASVIKLTPSAINKFQSHISLIVNTTPVGMYPLEDASPWPVEIPFPKHAMIYDLVYNPRETLLVKSARENGLPATTGLGMLIEQAALAFERWTGLQAPREVMLQAVTI